MAIFNEAFLDRYKKSKKDNNRKYHEPKKDTDQKKNVGKTVYKPEHKSSLSTLPKKHVLSQLKMLFLLIIPSQIL